jgi:hypothetical protein
MVDSEQSEIQNGTNLRQRLNPDGCRPAILATATVDADAVNCDAGELSGHFPEGHRLRSFQKQFPVESWLSLERLSEPLGGYLGEAQPLARNL